MIEICTDTIESDGKSFVAYGIKTDKCEYRDLCTDREKVRDFVRRIIKYDGFSLLDDLVEDFIEELYGGV